MDERDCFWCKESNVCALHSLRGNFSTFVSNGDFMCQKCWEAKQKEIRESPIEEETAVCLICKKSYLKKEGPQDMQCYYCKSCFEAYFPGSKPKPKFKVGQWWETRSGNQRFKITEYSSEYGTEESCWRSNATLDNFDLTSMWNIDGTRIGGKQHPLDLVKLIEDVE